MRGLRAWAGPLAGCVSLGCVGIAPASSVHLNRASATVQSYTGCPHQVLAAGWQPSRIVPVPPGGSSSSGTCPHRVWHSQVWHRRCPRAVHSPAAARMASEYCPPASFTLEHPPVRGIHGPGAPRCVGTCLVEVWHLRVPLLQLQSVCEDVALDCAMR